MSFQDNRYTTCGEDRPKWVFEGRTYETFDDYRNRTGQEKGSTWKPETAAPPCLGRSRPQEAESRSSVPIAQTAGDKDSAKASGWTVVSEIPVGMDASGLFDSVASAQLMILKNLEMEYRASGLRLKITLHLKQPASPETLQNAIHDLGLNGITASKPLGHESSTQPKTRFVAPDGQAEREWHDFVGPAELGFAIRGILGEPFYAGMEPDTP